jgi:hypothetical protein
MDDYTATYPGPLLPRRPHNSWVDSRTGAYCIGTVNVLPGSRTAMRMWVAQDWHSREVRVLSMAEVATLRPYPAEPIPQPEARA